MTRFRIEVADAAAHRFRVTLAIERPDAQQDVSLPVWIPGSYMVREFARHLSAFDARQAGEACGIEPLDKTTWRVSCHSAAPLSLRYEVYAFDPSVRAAFLDHRRGFWNGTSLCLRVHGRENEPHRVAVDALPDGWRVATAMRPLQTDALGRGVYEAADYDELIDHPFEIGRFWQAGFEAWGIPHELVVAGAWPSFDGDRLLADARRICEAEMAFWHGGENGRGGAHAVPFDRYVFFLNAVEDGYGGLEHRASTALVAARRDLPRRGAATTDGYTTLLGLVSHEYFHSWNVKRLKPAEFARLDPARENYTRLLWFFEGFTSYYNDLLLLRAGLIDAAGYLKLLARTITGVLGTPGRRVQSVAESSFDAWVKYYRQDENTVNATVSYYTKGALVALCLDLALRLDGGEGASLDAVMRRLWQRCGGGAVTERQILETVAEAGGGAIADALAHWVHGRDELPIEALLVRIGVRWRTDAAGFAQRLGLRVAEGPVTGVQVRSVLRGGAGERAGLSAGDELLAIDGFRLRKLDDALAWIDEAAGFELLAVRENRLLTLRVNGGAAVDGDRIVSLDLQQDADEAAAAARAAWLQG